MRGKPGHARHPPGVGAIMASKPKSAVGSQDVTGGAAPSGACCVELPVPDECCVSPCEPPWLPDKACLVWYEYRYLRVPLGTDTKSAAVVRRDQDRYIEFRILYQHRMCLIGKQHGPLLYTVTLLPGARGCSRRRRSRAGDGR